jgi:hypothetical protein
MKGLRYGLFVRGVEHMQNFHKLCVFAFCVSLSAVACDDEDNVQYYAIKYLIDVDPNDSMDYQERFETNSISECNKASNLLEMDFDIVFSDEYRETGHWKLRQCGEPSTEDNP